MKNGQMKEVKVGAETVLLVKDKDSFCAVGNKCSHYGAPLVKGAYSNGKVRCPWHGACFSTKTGDIEDFPGCSGIPTFPVRVDGENVIVQGTPDALSVKKTALPAYTKGNDSRVFVILGAGAAGTTAAFQLRKEGFKGRIVLVGGEKHVAYDRPKLSKAAGLDINKIQLFSPAEHKSQDIETKLGVMVTSLNAETRTVVLDNGETIVYDSCLIATGADPQRLQRFIKGNEVVRDNVLVVRTIEDAQAIVSTEGKDVVIIGSSFIGMETAACVVAKAKSVTVVGMEKVPFERVLGSVVGGVMQKLHESRGIKFIMEAVCDSFEIDDNGLVKAVVLKDGQRLECGTVVIGAGVTPATGYIQKSPLVTLARDGSVEVDATLATGAPGLFAAGDLARYPMALLDNHMVRIEHYGMAMLQGKVAAKNMLGAKKQVDSIPFFWTAQYGKSIRYAGHGIEVDEIVIDELNGKLHAADPAFIAYYGRKGKVVAAASLGADPVIAEVAQILDDGITLKIADLVEPAKAGKSAAAISKILHP
eukprot:TRINITY_DN10351_c0_g1_i1.p1 TRINITY_DN10351_c0_g1~~TRINITY_DN10351_c0_g1_i1.p1  ORF type:complete len:580 (-),score=151.92 TRINITY_DN10351_c0_g1_i1:69-1664(-)